ncbi:hypothetical protein ACFYV5_10785 [Streptomyces sp. NPDC003035]|uniref:hypothetical protein n=1 Tax=Streptomyces sp. NPDC003035 TaxID=3364676 RepID=UPI0036BA9625
MNASGVARRGAVLGRLLLVGVLAFAVFVMHTVGHADGSPVHGMAAASHSVGHPSVEPTDHDSDCSSALTEPLGSTHMASLCVGVISSSAAASPLRPALARHAGWSPVHEAGLTESPRPTPLWREPCRARLPVLRV